MTPSYLTTPIYYANDLPTIGHAYTTIAVDAVARYQRQRQQDVFFLTGTDEHGINIERVAAQRGLAPADHVGAIASAFADLWTRLDITYDRFIRTSEPAHTRAALALWDRLRASGDVYRGVYEGAYCPRCEAFVELETCPVHGLPCDHVQEENWFFRLSKYQAALEHLVRDTEFVQPLTRRNEVLGQLQQGLRDFSISRRQVRWGIPVPETPDEVLYVWVDALANYLTGVGFPDQTQRFERYWQTVTHVIGKEIIRFHCLYWPALLLSAGLPLPRRVFAHGWLTNTGEKISKTKGNGIDPVALVDELGSDAVRYYLLRTVPFGHDGDFSPHALRARYDADLANDFGNLVQRATSLAARHSGQRSSCAPGALERELAGHARTLSTRVAAGFDSLALHEAAAAVNAFVKEVNRYVDRTAPWARASGEAALAIEHIVEATRVAAWHYAPFIPRAADDAHIRLSGRRIRPGDDTFVPRPVPVCRVGAPLFPRRAPRLSRADRPYSDALHDGILLGDRTVP